MNRRPTLGALAAAAFGALVAPATAHAKAPAAPPADAPAPATSACAGVMPRERCTTWSPGIPGGVPAGGAVHVRLEASRFDGGALDASAVINDALKSAGVVAARTRVRQVVELGEGTYRLSSPLAMNRSDVVLRGAGPARTTLLVDNALHAIQLGRRQDYGRALDVTASIAKGSRTFQLRGADAAQIEVGDVLEIDQQDPPAALLPSGHMYTNGYVWLGDGHYNKRQPRSDFNGPGTGGAEWVWPAPPSSVDASLGNWDNAANHNARFTGPWRSVGQQIEIAAKRVEGDQVTFTTANPFHVAFPLERRPQLWHTGTRWTERRNAPGVQFAGVESLRIAGAKGVGDAGGITARNVAYCWVRDVEISGEDRVGGGALKGPLLSLQHAFRCEVRDSYVHHSRLLRPNSASYGIHLSNHCSDNLIENNIVTWLCKPIVLNSSGGGNVIGYNYVDNAVIERNGWAENGIDLCHATFCFGDLAEGNWTPNLGSDSTHGNAGWQTIFRNFASGRNSTEDPAPRRNLRAIGVDAWSGPHAVVGNVLHAFDAGHGVAYEATGKDHAGAAVRGLVYRLGDNGSGGRGDTWDDGTAAANLYRSGNWDNVTGRVVWDPAAPGRVLPPSLYLEAKPAFFESLPWPWVEPSGRGASDRVKTLPAKARFDAGKPLG